ncbi:Soyasaponin III rhamnosyltransferase [Handroanthus impetiginosus]|uniref:Soyasaponin III rhamnosyltransferase n=1 Tax=Handroanthus impetiginosus TaxID=429701 RepID=A0A2G9HK57_9LAMI|nr:Soyasaponin III rhamnosyltransferase [Handroanthus impetiginosus]
MGAEKYHIMMFPWLAFVHMIPFLELSKRLAAKGILISYVSTPKNLQRLPQIPSNLEAKMTTEATIDLQQDQIQFLKKSYDMLAEPFECLLQKVRSDLTLIDFAPYWIPDIATKFGILTGPLDELKSGKRRPSQEDYTSPPDWIPFPSLVALQPDYAPHMMQILHSPDALGMSSGQCAAKILEECSFVVVRSSEEFDSKYSHPVEDYINSPFCLLAYFLQYLRRKKKEPKNNMAVSSNWHDTCKWLEGQKPKSIVFVGFGSEYKMPIEQINELDFSLELSKLPFLRILRKPQNKKEVGSEVPRNEDGSFSWDKVAESIRQVLVAPEGEQLWLKAAQMRSIFDNHESQDNYINKFIEHMENVMS